MYLINSDYYHYFLITILLLLNIIIIELISSIEGDIQLRWSGNDVLMFLVSATFSAVDCSVFQWLLDLSWHTCTYLYQIPPKWQ